MCASQNIPLRSLRRDTYTWSSMGSSSSHHFPLKFTGSTLSSIHTTATTTKAHCFTFTVTLHSLVYSSVVAFFLSVSAILHHPSGVSDIPTKSSANIDPDPVSSPIVTPCYAASTATIMALLYTLNRFGDSVHLSRYGLERPVITRT